MPSDADLNEFQRRTEALLVEALIASGRALEGRFIYTGFDDATIHAHVSGTGLEVWIYPNGASYGHGQLKQQTMFEALDFSNDLERLSVAFAGAIVRECQARDRKGRSEPKRTWWERLFGAQSGPPEDKA